MKLQGFIVIFIIIILPIILVLSVYLHGQIDTIALQTQYDNALLNATYDSIMALERNTANENLSTVSDELRSMIEASTSIFMNSLSTSLGMSNASESFFRPYIPALLYTLYDGFYIYSPTMVPVISEQKEGEKRGVAKRDEQGRILYVAENGEETPYVDKAKKTIDYILKPYIYYNANYVDGDNFNISVNYSLDNYVTITGSIKDAYYSKSGYLIDPLIFGKNDGTGIYVKNGFDKVKYNIYDSSVNTEKEKFDNKYGDIIESIDSNKNLLDFNDEGLIEDICALNGIELKLVMKDRNNNDELIIIENNPWESFDGNEDTIKRVIESYNHYVQELPMDLLTESQKIEIENNKLMLEQEDELNEQAIDAICYYGKSYIFTKWVEDNLKDVNPHNHLNNVSADYVTTHLSNENTTKYIKMDKNIFNFQEYGGPEDDTSAFYNHRLEVIKSSIQYNLNSAISNYNAISEGNSGKDYNFEMPVLSDKEWEKVISNISMVSFFQGYPCKAKIYNNYAIVSSSSSEMMINPGNISNPRSNVINEEGIRVSNPGNLYFVVSGEANNEGGKYHRINCDELAESNQYLGFKSIDYVYDRYLAKGATKYDYDHKNLGCYNCIISGNYDNIAWKDLSNEKRRAYLIAVGKERYKLHKTTASVENSGFEVLPKNSIYESGTAVIDFSLSDNRKLSDIKSIEIVFGKTEIQLRKTLQLVELTMTLDGNERKVKLAANQSTNKTIVWDNLNLSSNSKTGAISLSTEATDIVNGTEKTYTLSTMEIKSIKIIYK